MVPKFEIYLGNDSAYYWRLRAANGEIVCWSQGYSSKQAAFDSINWVKVHGVSALIVES